MKRTLCILLSLMLALTGFAGLCVPAAAAGTGKAIRLVTNGKADYITGAQTSNVWFGNYKQSSDGADGFNVDPIKWRVLSNADGKLFLLSDQNLDACVYYERYFTATWETSTIRAWLNGTGEFSEENFKDSAFSSGEDAAVCVTDVSNPDSVFDDRTVPGGSDTADKVFLLSRDEAMNTAYGFTNDIEPTDSRVSINTAYTGSGGSNYGWTSAGGSADYWWLRSPGSADDRAAIVYETGQLNPGGYDVPNRSIAVRPAMNVDLGKVLFTSSAVGGKADDGLTAVRDYTGSDWKLTLLDDSRSFAVTQTALSAISGFTTTMTYSGATVGESEYISAILTDENGVALYYGRLAQPTAANGTVEVAIPADLAAGDYTLKVFSEQVNGDKKTDFASTPVDVTLTVKAVCPAGKAIRLVQDGAADYITGAQQSSVWFGNYMQSSASSKEPVKWRVLSNADGKLFLLSDQNLDVVRYNESLTGVPWETCTLRKWLNDYDGHPYDDAFIGSAFNEKELSAVAESELENANNPQHGTSGGSKTTDKVFLLSIAEATNTAYGFTDDGARSSTNTAYVAAGGHTGYTRMGGVGKPDCWWLRSPGEYSTIYYSAGNYSYSAATVYGGGSVDYSGFFVYRNFVAVRPALNLDLKSVLFTSAAAGGKSGDGLTAVDEYTGSEWKLTLLDESRSAFTASFGGAQDDVYTISYNGATTGENEKISAMTVSADGVATYYGVLCDAQTGENTVTVDLAGKLHDGDKLYVFNEQVNGDKKTDFSSALVDVTPTIMPDLTVNKADLKTDLNTSDARTIWYGGTRWRVIGYDGAGVASSTGTMTLFADGSMGTSYFDFDGKTGRQYAGSDLEKQTNQIYNNAFSDPEQFAVQERTLNAGTYDGANTDGVAGSSVGYARLWPLSTKEANAVNADLRVDTGAWWLRSPGDGVNNVAFVKKEGNVDHIGQSFLSSSGVRPAFYVDLGKVIFASAAVGGKQGDGALTPVEDSIGGECKLTLWEGNHRWFTVNETDVTARPGGTVTLHYQYAETGENEYISAIVTDLDGNALYYGRIMQPTDENGTLEITIPADLEKGAFSLYVFNEQVNGDKMTDYASNLIEVVKADAVKAADLQTGDTFEMGMYPQTQVTDDATITALNAIDCTMTDYGYMQNSKADNHTFDAVDMTYADIAYNGQAYRKVTINEYRPYFTVLPSSSSNTYQADNGYVTGNTYYFKWEPIVWQVLARESDGVYVMSQSLLDSPSYHNYLEFSTWETSSLRTWLNEGFYNGAFSEGERSKLISCTLSNVCDNPFSIDDGGNDTTDKLWVLSFSDSIDSAYGFQDRYYSDPAKEAAGTDYAKSQGLSADPSNGCSIWWLRSPGEGVPCGSGINENGYGPCNPRRDSTEIGVRPAFKLSLDAAVGTADSDICRIAEHSYGDWTSADADNHKKVCSVCGDIVTETHSWNPEWSKDSAYHWHECTVCDAKKDETEHRYGKTEYIWDDDYAYVKAEHECMDCGWTETETAPTSSETTKEPTCTEKGVTTYTAEFENLAFDKWVREVENIPSNNHSWATEWSKDADKHWHDCENCDEKKDEAEHDWGDWTEADADNHKRVCSVCGAEETASHSWAFLEWDWRIEPNVIYTDMNRPDIYYTVKCSGCGEEKSIKYDNRIPTFTAFAPTCTEDGWTQYEAPLTYNGESHDYTYIFTADVLGDHYKATGHDWGDWNAINDTQHQRICKNDGTHKETESHIYGDISYTWEQVAGAWKATAKRTCTVCKWEETETVTATGAQSKAPTCTANGETTYTATFSNTAFETQQKTVADIAALNHDWKTEWSKDGVHHWHDCTRCDEKNDEAAHTYGDISYTWEQTEGKWKATAKRTCTVCKWEETETVTATGAQSKAPTCTVNGETTYTAQFENAAFETQQKTVADIAALDHDWKTAWSKDGDNHWHDCTRCNAKNDEAAHTYGEVSYTWEQTGGAWKATAKHACTICGWEESETVNATGAQSKAPTCTVNGETTYTATFSNPAFETKTKTVADIDALNHDWDADWSKDGVNHWHECTRCDEKNDEAAHTYGEVTYTWEQTRGAWKATAKHACTVCGWEESETVDAAGAQSKAPTCTVNGETTYTAAFGKPAFETQTKTVDDISALDHAYDAVVTEPTCTEDGYTTHTCSRCGDSYTDSETDALGHVWGDWEIVRTATPNEKGEKKRVCTRCGEVETAEIDELILTSSVDGQTGSSLVVTVPYAKRGAIATTLTAEEPVTYTSSNPKLLTVDKNGNVQFVRLCIFCKSATITAVSADGSKVATCKVNIEIKWWQYIIWFFLGSLWF